MVLDSGETKPSVELGSTSSLMMGRAGTLLSFKASEIYPVVAGLCPLANLLSVLGLVSR